MAMELETWTLGNPVSDSMRWKGAAKDQIDRFMKLAEELNVPVQVVGHHTSKSIRLPVVELVFAGKGRILLRDNFHSLEMAVLWDFIPALTYSDVYPEVRSYHEGEEHLRDWDWYQAEIARCQGYSWNGWSDAEMADPRITRVQVTHSNGNKYWNEKTPKEKDIWAKRMTDPEWHHTQWGSGRIFYDGIFGPDAKLYIGDRTYLEGIADLIPYTDRSIYENGKQNFTLSTSWEAVSGIINRIRSASHT